jgi:hypothetical protein
MPTAHPLIALTAGTWSQHHESSSASRFGKLIWKARPSRYDPTSAGRWQHLLTQSIKQRVHRIGQTRPISVKTLAIKASAEEVMVARRHALHNTLDKIPKLIEERGMRDFVAVRSCKAFSPGLAHIKYFAEP